MTITSCLLTTETDTNVNLHEVDYQKVVNEMMHGLKNGDSVETQIELLKNSTEDELKEQLKTDNDKITFWVNVYNAYIQIILSEHQEYYQDRRSFFKTPHIEIAGQHMTFADIEHGIIRRSQFEYFLGYVRNPFVSRYKKMLRPKKKDFRIHFALNCGAKSCPPVGIYTPENLDAQFDASAKKFLHDFSKYNATKNEVLTTPLFSWFRGDFKGKKGVKEILKRYGVVPSEDVELSFDRYDWTLALNNYVEWEDL